MKYMLLVRVDPEARPTPEEADPAAWHAEGARTGAWLEGHRLREPADATTVRLRDGKVLIADGPFAEFKEHIAGFDIVEAASLDAAADYASRHPVARFGAIEVREVWEDFDEPAEAPATDLTPHTPTGRPYLMMMVSVPDAPAVPPGSDVPPTAWNEEMERRGVTRGAHRLRPAGEATAASARVRGGRPLLTHGPYAEVTEQVGGYDLVVAADLDEAIEIAAKHPSAWRGAVEIRPLWQPEPQPEPRP